MSRLVSPLLPPKVPERKTSKYIYPYIVANIAALVHFTMGLHETWLRNQLPWLLSSENPRAMSPSDGSMMASMCDFASIPGIILALFINDKLGRLWSLKIAMIPYVISSIIYITTMDRYYLFLSQFLNGLSLWIATVALPVYLVEISSNQNRGTLISWSLTQQSIGDLMGFVLFSIFKPDHIGYILLALAVIILPCLFFLPESPYFLMDKKNREKELLQSLKKLNLGSDELTQLRLSQIFEQNTSYYDLFSVPVNFYALQIAVLFMLSVESIAYVPITKYSQVIFADAQTLLPLTFSGMMYSAMSFLSMIICLISFERCNRRNIYLASVIGCLIALLILTLRYVVANENDTILAYATLVGMIVYNLAGCVLGSLYFVILGELFPSKLKTFASCIVTILKSILNIGLINIFQVAAVAVGYSWLFGSFTAFLIITSSIVWLILPETRGIGLEDIQGKLHLRKFGIST